MRADALDEYWKKHKKPSGPLHGLPVSVKECIGIKGLDYNAGFVAWVGRKAPDDAPIIEILLRAGCVLHARTTEPQTLVRARHFCSLELLNFLHL